MFSDFYVKLFALVTTKEIELCHEKTSLWGLDLR